MENLDVDRAGMTKDCDGGFVYEASTSNHDGIQEYVVNLRKTDIDNGVLRINSEIYDSTSIVWLQEIDQLKRAGLKEVLVKITCPGGSAYHSIALYDALNDLRAGGVKVTTKVEGYAASAASAFILQASDWRQAGPSSRILVHEIRGNIGYGRESDVEDERAEMMALSNLMLSILEKRTGHDAQFWQDKTRRREQWFSASEALELGLIDEIK